MTLETRVPEGADAGAPVSLGVPALAGVYRLSGVVPDDRIVAVNVVNARESAIVTSDDVPIATRGGASARAGEAAPREVWTWFVIGAGTMLVLEWLLFAWRMRV